MPQEAIESLASIAHSLEVVMQHQETSAQVLEQHWRELDVDTRQRLEARQMDRRRLAWMLALGILLGVLLVLVGAAIMAGMIR
jgi:hypothetical protein